MGEPKGWWCIAVSNRVLRKLDRIRSDVQEKAGECLSYSSVIDILIKKIPV